MKQKERIENNKKEIEIEENGQPAPSLEYFWYQIKLKTELQLTRSTIF